MWVGGGGGGRRMTKPPASITATALLSGAVALLCLLRPPAASALLPPPPLVMTTPLSQCAASSLAIRQRTSAQYLNSALRSSPYEDPPDGSSPSPDSPDAEEESFLESSYEGLDSRAYLASRPGNEVFGSAEPVILPEGTMDDGPGGGGGGGSGGGSPCVIKVLGIGGGGGNAVNRMIATRVSGVAFWALNTDAQALSRNYAPNTLNIGRQLTRGLGAGGDPAVGKQAAVENLNDIEHICKGADMIFITAGMGGGTGSGAAPIVADVAKNTAGCLTVGVVTKPFAFEGRRRMNQALAAIEELRKVVDTLIVVSNDKLLRIVPENTPVTDAFLVADDILRQGVVGVTEIILRAGMVNLDFADIRTVMRDAGTGIMGLGTGIGKTRATDAALAAISSPLLDFPISSARRVVFNVVGSSGMSLDEINSASEVIHENAHEDANIMFGALIDDGMGDEVSVTVVACDFRPNGEEDEDDYSSSASAAPSSSSSSSTRSADDRASTRGARGGSGRGDGGARGGRDEEGEWRDPNFYKDRRRLTRSPLGPDASLDDTRRAITRGFRMPSEYDEDDERDGRESSGEGEEKKREKKGGGGMLRGFFGRLRRKK